MRRYIVAFFVLANTGTVGCTRPANVRVEAPTPPAPITSLDVFESELSTFVLLDLEAPSRAPRRALLTRYLLTIVDETLEDDFEQAFSAFEFAAGLYAPPELHHRVHQPDLAARAMSIYQWSGRRGYEQPAMFGLAMLEQFGDESQQRFARTQWDLLGAWLTDNGPNSDDPLLRDEVLQHAFEQTASLSPTPFVTQQLNALYVERFKTASSMRFAREPLALRRTEITGYLMMRAHLCADDIEAAIAVTDQVAVGSPTTKLAEALHKGSKSTDALVEIARQFEPDPDGDLSQPFTVQGWCIVDNMTRRALTLDPNHAQAHLFRAQMLRARALTQAALSHLTRTLELDAELFDAWVLWAGLDHEYLVDLATTDVSAAVEHLKISESMHEQAATRWPEHPLFPGLAQSWFAVGYGLYQAGSIDEAITMLERSITQRDSPPPLDLLGTIAFYRHEDAVAERYFRRILDFTGADASTRSFWLASAQHKLGLLHSRQGDAIAAQRAFQTALTLTNAALASGASGPSERADQLVARGQNLFLLGDDALAIEDFHRAIELTPSRVSVYTDPLKLMITYGRYDSAKAIYRRAMTQGSLPASFKLYFSLWMLDLAERRQLPADPQAMSYVASYDETGWSHLLALHAIDTTDFNTLLQHASDPGERAEAYFYEGLRQWRQGDRATAKTLLQEVIKTDMMGFFEYELASAYLAWDELPTQPRIPIAAQSTK